MTYSQNCPVFGEHISEGKNRRRAIAAGVNSKLRMTDCPTKHLWVEVSPSSTIWENNCKESKEWTKWIESYLESLDIVNNILLYSQLQNSEKLNQNPLLVYFQSHLNQHLHSLHTLMAGKLKQPVSHVYKSTCLYLLAPRHLICRSPDLAICEKEDHQRVSMLESQKATSRICTLQTTMIDRWVE